MNPELAAAVEELSLDPVLVGGVFTGALAALVSLGWWLGGVAARRLR